MKQLEGHYYVLQMYHGGLCRPIFQTIVDDDLWYRAWGQLAEYLDGLPDYYKDQIQVYTHTIVLPQEIEK